ncbi:MAG: hypothetical protein WCT04_19070 [Planctomycetota bacterium]
MNETDTQPLAVYHELCFDYERKTLLFDDRVFIEFKDKIKGVVSKSTVSLDNVSPEYATVLFTHRLFKSVLIGLTLGVLVAGPGLGMVLSSFLVGDKIETNAYYFLVGGSLTLLWVFQRWLKTRKKREAVVFMTTMNTSAFEFIKSAEKVDEFDQFVLLVVARIKAFKLTKLGQ